MPDEATASGEVKNACYLQRLLKHFLELEDSSPPTGALSHYFISVYGGFTSQKLGKLHLHQYTDGRPPSPDQGEVSKTTLLQQVLFPRKILTICPFWRTLFH